MSTGQRLRRLLWFGAAAAIAAAVACGGSGVQSPTAATGTNASSGSTPGNGTTPPSGTGTLKVSIKDSPFSDAKALLVTFSEVSVHTSTDSWEKLPFAGTTTVTTRTCDLKRLQQAEDVLGVGTLTAGHYTQIRLAVSSARLYFTATTSATGPVCAETLTLSDDKDLGVAIDVPSDTLKLNREFDVPAGGATKILLDFDGDKSINQLGNGKYKMMPVIAVVSVQ